MYVADPNLTVPADGASLWRYQTFDKFMQLLEGGTLWFSRADKFVDRFEVAVPDKDRQTARASLLESMRQAGADDFVSRWLNRFAGLTADQLQELPDEKIASLMPRFANRFAYVSSWHHNDTESAGLWTQYTADGNGVAVRTTAETLREVLDAGTGDAYKVALGEVHYLDYHADSWGAWHQFSATFHKRRSFAYEQEVRAVISWPDWEDVNRGHLDPGSMPDHAGLNIPVDLRRLVHSVVISPNATPWFAGLVAAVMQRYGLTGIPVHSELNEEPVW
jgi:hypothetical protein